MSVSKALNIPEWQVLLHLPTYNPAYHHRILHRKVTGDRWVVSDPQWRVGIRDLSGVQVIWPLEDGSWPDNIIAAGATLIGSIGMVGEGVGGMAAAAHFVVDVEVVGGGDVVVGVVAREKVGGMVVAVHFVVVVGVVWL